jgi:hypothetical protein
MAISIKAFFVDKSVFYQHREFVRNWKMIQWVIEEHTLTQALSIEMIESTRSQNSTGMRLILAVCTDGPMPLN